MKKNTILTNLTVESLDKSGTAVFRLEENDRPLHVSGGLLPGMICDVRVIRKNRRAILGRVVAIHDMGPLADIKNIRCAHYMYPEDPTNLKSKGCGGCKWQALSYKDQLDLKQKSVEKSLSKNHVDVKVHPVLGSPEVWGYRNKVEYTFGKYITGIKEEKKTISNRSMGFHKQGLFGKIIDIDHCDLVDEKVNELFNYCKTLLRDYPVYDQVVQEGALRYLMIRQAKRTGQLMLVLSLATKGLDDNQVEELKKMLQNDERLSSYITTGVLIVHNGLGGVIADKESERHTLRGEGIIQEQLLIDDKTFSFNLSPKSFFQTNSTGCELLYGTVANMIEESLPASSKKGTLVDLYCGTGTIGIIIASLIEKFDRLIGIDEVEGAISDARVNAIHNASDLDSHFFAGRTEKVMHIQEDKLVMTSGEESLSVLASEIGTIIVDPPRSGLHEDAINTLVSLKIAFPAITLCYISCNPDTLARDLRKLQSVYAIHKVQPLDMFPHTHHIETIVSLT